ncbi:uncharacterized protein LOC123316705 [Coccinella septempunctata]|uniref:uncharacterized protein LOC123316705 n=1 Tax=Coccinella septempunctata TaxID=41139 RepID=UPI001D084201|nr:uncharacterized protein LOC123316705 [Coccinella septempunctata]
MDFLNILKPKKNKFSEELITQAVDLENGNAIGELPENSVDVISFKVDYLGCLPVNISPEFDVDNGLKFLKRERERNKIKTQKGVILISNYIRLTDMREKEIFRIPLLRLSSCSMDPFNKKVFFFIHDKTTYHAFLCDKWKNAYNAAQAIAHMYGRCHENYLRDMQNRKFVGMQKEEESGEKTEEQRFSRDMMDFSMDFSLSTEKNQEAFKNWVSFED